MKIIMEFTCNDHVGTYGVDSQIKVLMTMINNRNKLWPTATIVVTTDATYVASVLTIDKTQ